MSITAVVASEPGPDEEARGRFGQWGLTVIPDNTMMPEHPVATGLETVLAVAAAQGAFVVIGTRGDDPQWWRRSGVDWLTRASESTAVMPAGPLWAVVLPAVSPPGAGPVAVLSPAGSASSYGPYVGAVVAAGSRRRVEHLNGRGNVGTFLHDSRPARALVRAAVSDWHERSSATPERDLCTLSSRPSVVVMPVPPGSGDAARVVADHPDADIILLFDTVAARFGAPPARQVSDIVEISFGVGMAVDGSGEMDDAMDDAMDDVGAGDVTHDRDGTGPVVSAVGKASVSSTPDAPDFRASDVIHVRFTDSAIEIANRTSHVARVRVGVGSTAGAGRAVAAFEATIDPRDSRREPVSGISALTDLDAPTPVLRHWSHGDAEVFEGGERRIVGVEVEIRDSAGTARGRQIYDAPNGLDFLLTARDLTALVGDHQVRRVLPEPAPQRARTRQPVELLPVFARALAAGRAALPDRRG